MRLFLWALLLVLSLFLLESYFRLSFLSPRLEFEQIILNLEDKKRYKTYIYYYSIFFFQKRRDRSAESACPRQPGVRSLFDSDIWACTLFQFFIRIPGNLDKEFLILTVQPPSAISVGAWSREYFN